MLQSCLESDGEETYRLVCRCVEAKNAESGGLRDGEECEKESEAYRECRRKVKELRAAVKK